MFDRPCIAGLAPTRRAVLACLAAPAIARRARADGPPVIVGTWGGTYGQVQLESVNPVLASSGREVVQAIGDEATRVAQVMAQRRLPRGSMDVVGLNAPFGWRLHALDLLETLDEDRVPNLRYVRPELRTDFMVPQISTPQVIMYNPASIAAPANFADLLSPPWKGKVGFVSSTNIYLMMMASLYAAGTTTDIEQAKPLLLRLNAEGLRLYPETDTIAPAMKTGEILGGPQWLARVVMWKNLGFPVAAAFPAEGAVEFVSSLVVPKNAPNKQGAFDYLNAALAPGPQRRFAEQMGYLPTVTNAELTGKVAQDLALPAPTPKQVSPDYAFLARESASFSAWWQTSILHG